METPKENPQPMVSRHLDEMPIPIHTWNFWLQTFWFAVHFAMPFLFYLVIAAQLENTLFTWWLGAWLGALTVFLMSVVFAFQTKSSKGERGNDAHFENSPEPWRMSLALGFAILISVYAWLGMNNGLALGIFLLLLSMAALFRVQRWQRQPVTPSEGRRAFIFDTIAIVAVGVYLLLVSAINPVHSAITGFTALAGCLLAFSRIYLLWFTERQRSGAAPSAKTAWLPLLALAVLLALLGPGLIFHSITALAGLLGILVFPVLLIIQALHLHLKLPPGFLAPHQLQLANHLPPGWQKSASSPPAWMHDIPIVLLVILLLVLVFLLFRKNRKKNVVSAEDIQTVKVVERKSVPSRSGLSFLPTQNPIRLRVQQWLLTKQRDGSEIQSFETVRKFSQHSGPLPEQDLLTKYEESRYNQQRQK